MKRLNEKNPNTVEYMNATLHEEGGELNYGDMGRYELLAKHFTGGRFIDIGCYHSPLAVEVKKKFPEAECYALDHADKLIEHFQGMYPDVHYITADCHAMPFPDSFFDYAVAGELIEHLEEPARFIAEAMRVLKSGGWFALSTPLRESRGGGSIGGKYHLWSFELEDIEDFLKQYGVPEVVEDNRVIEAWVQKTL